jgi:hypothetical protein
VTRWLLAAVALGLVGCKTPSKVPEARRYLEKLSQGARVYAIEVQAESNDDAKPVFLVADSGLQPAPGSCCKHPEGICPPARSLWEAQPWESLRFAIDDPVRYSYQYVSDGATFTVRAVGDLDCDGTFSTFEIVGQVQGGEVTVGSMTRHQELE